MKIPWQQKLNDIIEAIIDQTVKLFNILSIFMFRKYIRSDVISEYIIAKCLCNELRR